MTITFKKGNNEKAVNKLEKGYRKLLKDYCKAMDLDITDLNDLDNEQIKLLKTSFEAFDTLFEMYKEQAKTLDELNAKMDKLLEMKDE